MSFPGNKFRGEIIPAIQELVDAGTIRIIDILFAVREGDAEASCHRAAGDPERAVRALRTRGRRDHGPHDADDVRHLSAGLEPDSTMALLLFENTWARKVGDAIEAANGRVLMFERIPRPVVQELIAEREQLLAEAASA